MAPNRKLTKRRGNSHSPPLSLLGPLCGPLPSTVGPPAAGRCASESTHTHSCGTRHRRPSGSHRYFFSSASVPHSRRSPSARHSHPWSAHHHLQQRSHSASRLCRRPRCRSSLLPIRAPFLSFPFLSLLRRRVTSWRLVSPLPTPLGEPRPAPRGRGQGSGLSPGSSFFRNNNSSPLRRESDVCR